MTSIPARSRPCNEATLSPSTKLKISSQQYTLLRLYSCTSSHLESDVVLTKLFFLHHTIITLPPEFDHHVSKENGLLIRTTSNRNLNCYFDNMIQSSEKRGIATCQSFTNVKTFFLFSIIPFVCVCVCIYCISTK